MKEYITGIQALNYHHYDWHNSYFDFNKSVYKNAKELKKWLGSFGIENNIANPYRAFLDLLYNDIHFSKRVPNHKIDFFLFDENEEKELLSLIDKYLKPNLNNEELEILEKWKNYNSGGRYDFRSKKRIEREIRRRKNKTSQ